MRAYGMEHRSDLCAKAREAGLTVSCAYPETEDDVFEHAPFDGFTSFNFLEHQPDPATYLRAIANNLTADGTGLVTVPSFEYILEQNSFYEIIPDHLAYYTMETLTSLFSRCGFDVLKKERVNRDTLAMIVRKRKKPDVSGLLLRKETIRREVLGLIETAENAGRKTAVWGASHQGFTLSSVAQLSGRITCIIDSAPFKQGRFAPASHIPIVSPETAAKNSPGVIIIVAPGYTDEIAGEIRKRFPAGTEIYVLMTDHLTKYGTV